MIKTNVGAEKKLEITKEMSLKAYAFLSVRKDIAPEALKKDTQILSLAFAFTNGDAVLATQQALEDKGFKLEEYKHPHLMLVREMSEVIDMVPMSEGLQGPGALDFVFPKQNPSIVPENPALKSAAILETSVRYVFGEVATMNEKAVMEKVIKKFIKWAEDKSRKE